MAKLKYINGDAIFTDAGWEDLLYQDALEYFSGEEIKEWWFEFTAMLDLQELCEELQIDVPNDEETLDEIYDMLPKQVSVIVAKANYHDEKWVSVLSLPDGDPFFTDYEKKAILLGIKLRTVFNLNIPIVNDNKDAVKELKVLYPYVQWARRNKTKVVHNSQLSNATRFVKKETLRPIN